MINKTKYETQEQVEQRIAEIVVMPEIKRPPAMMELLKNGGYDQGWTKQTMISAIKKAVRALKKAEQQGEGDFSKLETDVGKHFAAHYCERFRFNTTRGQWMIWNGHMWEIDDRERVIYEVGELVFKLRAGIPPDDETGQYEKMSTNRFVRNVADYAKAQPEMVTTEDDYDDDPYLLNTPDGVWDLRTGKRQENDPDLMMTMSTSVVPDFDAEPVLWNETNDQTFAMLDKMRAFTFDYLGLALSGAMHEEVFTFMWGPGGNGKGVLINTVMRVMGSYATVATETAFTTDDRGDTKHTTELAELRGKRLVIISEIEEGQYLRIARIKQNTGNEVPIKARFLFQGNFVYWPVFKLLFVSNFAPKIKNANKDDKAVIRRMNTVHCPHRPKVVDSDLKRKLEAEHGAILADLIRRAGKVLEDGLQRPGEVREATEEFMSDQDIVGSFIDACLDKATEAKYPLKMVREAYDIWAVENGMGTGKITAQRLRKALIERLPKGAISTGNDKTKSFLIGYALSTDVQNLVKEHKTILDAAKVKDEEMKATAAEKARIEASKEGPTQH